MVRKILTMLAAVLFFTGFTQNYLSQNLSGNSALNERPLFQKGVITVKLKERLPQSLAKGTNTLGISSVDEKLSRYGAKSISKRFNHKPIPSGSDLPDLSRIYKIELPDNTDIEKLVEELSEDSNVEYAEPVPIYYPNDVPNDSLYSLQDHLKQIKAEEAWDIHKCENGSKPIIIGICDTGVKWDHPDLIDNIWQNLGEDADNDGHVIEWADSAWVLDPGDRNGIDDDRNGYPDDFIGWNSMGVYGEDPSNPNDPDGHGTHVAGIAAATTNNEIGVAGISWNAKIMTVCQSSNLSPYPGYIIDGYQGIIYLAEAGADIINCSWGSDFYYRAAEEAVKYASMLGSIVVCAAGNDGVETVNYPARYPHTIAVGGINSEDGLYSWTNYGSAIDVMAPYKIYSTSYTDDYTTKSGTSMSSPLAAGLLALMKSYFPGLSNEKLVERIMYTADNIDGLNPGYENKLGGGRINAFRALTDSVIVIPEMYKLIVNEVSLSTGEEAAVKAGSESTLTLTVQNCSNYLYNDRVTFYLSSDDPDVEIISNSVSGKLIPDDYTYIKDAFTIRIKEDAEYHFVTLKITADSDIPVVMSDYEFTLEILPSSGIFVYELNENDPDFSGIFLQDFFVAQGYDVIYNSGYSFPSSLTCFDAVFLSYGATDYGDPELHESEIEEYLEQGGKLYVESAALFSYYTDNKNLLALLGLQNVKVISELENPIDTLYGMDNTITEGMVFTGTVRDNVEAIEVYEPNAIGKAAFTGNNYGIVGIQNEGLQGQRSLCFSYPFAQLFDSDSASNRINFLKGICSFFNITINFYADFDARTLGGHVPFTVKFYDLSTPDSGMQIISRKWDFNNDNIVDSEELYPEWTYDKVGIYTVSLEISDGVNTKTVTKNEYIKVVGKENALEFNGSSDYYSKSTLSVMSDSTFAMNTAMTFEIWIKPYEGDLSGGSDCLFNKFSTAMFLNCDGKLITFRTIYDYWTDTYTTHTTPANSITLGEWQHIAATYDVDQKEMKIFIDGIEQQLTSDGELPDTLEDNSLFYLSVGSEGFWGNTFYGAIDEIRMWNLLRSGDEISEFLYKGLRGDEEGLLAYLPLNEGFGDEVSDYSIYHRNAHMQYTEWVEGAAGLVTSTEEKSEFENIPDSYTLYQNYPNPFNPTTTIGFFLQSSGKVTLEVYNILGEKVATLVNEEMEKGFHSVVFNAGHLASGIYCYRLKSKKFSEVKKLVLLK
ncbi:MAG: S8 family serine peptidase [Ignavibacteria bacterium]|jgi:subtilisin family serine protease